MSGPNGKFQVCIPCLSISRVFVVDDLLTPNCRYEYVRNFERDEILLPNTWIVVRIDGRGFHKYV